MVIVLSKLVYYNKPVFISVKFYVQTNPRPTSTKFELWNNFFIVICTYNTSKYIPLKFFFVVETLPQRRNPSLTETLLVHPLNPNSFTQHSYNDNSLRVQYLPPYRNPESKDRTYGRDENNTQLNTGSFKHTTSGVAESYTDTYLYVKVFGNFLTYLDSKCYTTKLYV